MLNFFSSLGGGNLDPSQKYISNQLEFDNLTINNGDSIFFERGKKFQSSNIQIDKDNVSISSFGEGEKPILQGSRVSSGWANQGSGIYYSNPTYSPSWVYVDGKQIAIAQSEYKPVLSRSGNTFTADSTYFNQFTNLVGSKIRVFEFQFRMSFEYTVTAYSSGTFTIDRDLIIAGNGYYFFVYGNLEFLTQDNTFHIDGNEIYVKLPQDPSNYTIELGHNDDTINVTGENCTIQDIEVRHSQKAGIRCYDKTINVSNCNIYEHRGNGLYVFGQNCIPTLQNNTITYVANNGIRIGSAKDGTVSGNIIHDISVLPSPGFPQTDALLNIGRPIDNSHGTTDDTTKVTGNAIILDFDYLESPVG